MNDEQIKHMVDRFLGWRLPEHFRPDAGISFDPFYNVAYNAAFNWNNPKQAGNGEWPHLFRRRRGRSYG